MGLGYLFCCTKSSKSKESVNKAVPRWRVFSLKELHSATNNFNYDNKLGEGAFGSVYWGQLWDGSQITQPSAASNKKICKQRLKCLEPLGNFQKLKACCFRSFIQIAVKRLKTWSNKAEMEFAVEIQVLARVRHENLLSLRGYCAEGKERLIVYDYMPNLSLLSHLHGHHAVGGHLDWGRRMNIAIGSAEGIAYLHHHATPHIIHRDIKASNILLDSEFQARVADFGFAKLIPDGATHVTTRVKGTLGYLAPEYAMLGKAKESCDVYSFGVLLLELVSGKKPIDQSSLTSHRTIIEWAFPLALQQRFEEIADPKLSGKFVKGEFRRLVLVALICAQNKPENRPIMLDVVDLLKGVSKEKLLNLEDNELFKEDSIPTHQRFTISEDSGNAMDACMG